MIYVFISISSVLDRTVRDIFDRRNHFLFAYSKLRKWFSFSTTFHDIQSY